MEKEKRKKERFFQTDIIEVKQMKRSKVQGTCIFVRDTGKEEGENIVEGDTFKNCRSGFLDTNGHEWERIRKRSVILPRFVA